MNKDSNSGELTLKETSVGKYRLTVNVDAYTFTTYVTVVDRIQLNTFYWTLSTSSKFPGQLENTTPYPQKLTNIKNAQDDHYLHAAVSTIFRESETHYPS